MLSKVPWESWPTKWSGAADVTLVSCPGSWPSTASRNDELIGTLTLAKLQKYSGKVIAFNFDGFYEPLKALLDHYVSLGMLDTASRELILFPQTVDELVGLLK